MKKTHIATGMVVAVLGIWLMPLAPAVAEEGIPAAEPAVAEPSAPEAATPAAEAAPEAAGPEAVPPEAGLPPPEVPEPAALEAPAEPAVEPPPPAKMVEVVTERAIPAVQASQGELITLTLDNVPIQDVIRMFTRVSGANIVAGTNLQGNVTVSLQNVEWRPALNVILDSINMALVEKTPGIFTVMSRAELAAEPLTVDTIFLQYITAPALVPIVKQMLVTSNATVSAFPSANALVVQETAPRLTAIKETISRIDKPRPQVFIEAKFVELNDQAIKDLGINWQSLENYSIGATGLGWTLNDERTREKSRTAALAETDRRSQADTLVRNYDMDNVLVSPGGPFTADGFAKPKEEVVTVADPTLDAVSGRGTRDTSLRAKSVDLTVKDAFTRTFTDARAAILTANDFAVTLSALKQNRGVSIVSNPKIVVASGETATIHVGSERPNISATVQAGQDGAPYFVYRLENYIPVGVRVDVTPTVNTESNITVKIVPELSRAPRAADEVITQTGQRFPVKTISTVATEFNIENNRTVAIGGLSLTDDQEKVIKIPVLGDIPIIGKYLFRHTHTEKTQNEIVIFVTVALAKPHTMFERTGIPSEGQLIHRHLTSREAQPVATGNGDNKARGKSRKKK